MPLAVPARSRSSCPAAPRDPRPHGRRGLVTAVAAAHLAPMVVGTAASIWPGSALRLYWLGLAGAAVIGLDAMGAAAGVPALAAMMASALAVAPLAATAVASGTAIQPSAGRVLPALVTAQASAAPWIGTLRIHAPAPTRSSSLRAALDDLRAAVDLATTRRRSASSSRRSRCSRATSPRPRALARTDAFGIRFILPTLPTATCPRRCARSTRSPAMTVAVVADTPLERVWRSSTRRRLAGGGSALTRLRADVAIAPAVLHAVRSRHLSTRRRCICSARGRDADLAAEPDGG